MSDAALAEELIALLAKEWELPIPTIEGLSKGSYKRVAQLVAIDGWLSKIYAFDLPGKTVWLKTARPKAFGGEKTPLELLSGDDLERFEEMLEQTWKEIS